MALESKMSNANKQIKENLQRVYNAVLEEEVPQEFLDLISRLKAEKASKERSSDDQ